MPNTSPEIDIARNIRAIEWLKAEIIDGIASLMKALLKNGEDAIVDALAAIVISCYLLGRRLGFGFNRVDERVMQKLESEIEAEHELEQWYGDLSLLRRYREEKSLR